MIPYGSILKDAQLAQALSIELAPMPEQAQAPASPFYGSTLMDPRVAAAASAEIPAAPEQPQAQASPFYGSTLMDPKVAAAASAEIPAAPEQQPPPASPFYGSTLMDPKVAEAIALDVPAPPDSAGADPALQRYGSVQNDSRVGQAAGMDAPAPQLSSLALVKNALNGGELAPEMQARYDLPRYQLGCESLLNMIPLPGGGITKRPGLRLVGNTGVEEENLTGRLIPWVYSEDHQLMLLLMTHTDGTGSTKVYYLTRDGDAEPRPTFGELPHLGNEIFELTWCQIGKYIYIAHHNHPPMRLCIEPQFGGVFYKIEREDLTFSNADLPRPLFPEIETDGGSSTADPVKLYYKVTAIDPETGEESLPSAAAMAEFPPPQAQGYHWVIRIKPVPGVREYRVYRKRGGEYGFIGRVTADNAQVPNPDAEGSGGEADDRLVFEDYNYAPDTTDRPPHEQTWFASPGDYPALVFMHQQRLGFAASDNDPLTLWLSQSSNFQSFSSKIPPTDDDGIEATLASPQGNRILWAVPDRSGLAIGTEGAEWFLTGASGEAAISPGSLSFQPQTSYGTQPGLMPVRANSSLLFVQRGGRCVRDLGYSFQADRYEANDLTLLAHHLFTHNRIVSWAWQESPRNILWCVLNSGKLAALTYMPEQEVIAWHRHETSGEFLSVATLDDSNGDSRAWFVVRRKVLEDGYIKVYHTIELMDPVFEGLPSSWDNPTPMAVPLHLDGPRHATFAARAVPCLPESGLENGPSTLAVKKVNAIKARVINSAPFSCRVVSQNAEPTPALAVPYPTPSANSRLARLSFTNAADWPCNIGAGFREAPRLELIFDGPNPVTLLGIAIQMEVANLRGGQV